MNLSKMPESNIYTLKDYAIERIAKACISSLCRILQSINALQNRSLCHDAIKSQNMARIYATASILELEKMVDAQKKYIKAI